MSYPYAYPIFPIFAFLGLVLSLIPLPWHLQAWNSGTCYFMIWTAIACLNSFINSVVWAQSVENFAPAWCEISIRIILGASVGIPASALCIVRRLYMIASVQSVTVSRAEKRRAVLIDSLICVLFPIVYIAMQYIVQGHRFDIFQEIGCYPAIYNTLPAYFISFMWPILIGLVSMVYCTLALRAFNRRRIQFNQFLASGTSLTMSRYFRLMALAMTAMLCTTPVACLVVYLNATATEIGPWRGWADTHFMYSRVEQIPSLIWRSSHQTVIAFELTRWAGPFCAVVFFAYFGFAQEARKHYRLALGAVGGAFWRGVGALGVRRPAAGFFAATSSSASQSQGKFALGAGVGYAKQHPSPHSPNSKHNAIDISLPAYSPGGTGSFTAGSFDADLKRAESFASTRSACTASASSSRFVERFIVRDPALDDVSVSSVYSADGHIDAHSPSSSHYHPETHPSRSHYHPDETHTPTSATSFHPSFVSSSTQETQTPTTPGSAFAYALPLHLGWAERAYPASPAPHAQGHAHRHGEEGQRGGEDSIRMEALRQQRQRHSV